MPWFSQPYTVERRPDTSVSSVPLGMWLFLASDAMLFAALFSAYFRLRASAPEPWLPLRDHLGVASINTIVLLGAAVALTFALRAARRDDRRAFRRLLHISGWLALVFMGVKLDEYGDLHGHNLVPSTNDQFALYFLLTGVHLLHVTGGALAIAWIGFWQRNHRESSPAAILNRVEAVLLYWYLVVLVWLVLFVPCYVV
jgi:heme/copper-type cytochrome/quinol oxidase subunit 3